MTCLADLCEPINEQCDPATAKASVYVGLEHIDSGAFFLKRHGSPSDVKSAKARFKEGDVLYGKLRPYLDKAVVAPCDGICSTDILVFRTKDKVVPAYVLALIHSDDFREHAEQTTNGVNHPRTSWVALSAFQSAARDAYEQEKIAAVLTTIQSAIDAEERLVATARELKQAAMHQLFSHGLCNEPQKETSLGALPQSWDVVTLGGIARLERGRFTHRPRNEPRFYGGDTPFVQTGDIVRSNGLITSYTQTLNNEGVQISRVFPRGTILITIAANIGYSGILDFDSACPDSVVAITPDAVLDRWFLQYFLETQQPEMDRAAPKGTQKNINIQFLIPWPVVVPPLDEQKAIASMLRAVDATQQFHERKRATLQDLFKTMLHELMSGKLSVADLPNCSGQGD